MKSIITHVIALTLGVLIGGIVATSLTSNFWTATDLATRNNLLGSLHLLLTRNDTIKAKKILEAQINQNVLLLERVRVHHMDTIFKLSPSSLNVMHKQWDNSLRFTKDCFSESPQSLSDETWTVIETRTGEQQKAL